MPTIVIPDEMSNAGWGFCQWVLAHESVALPCVPTYLLHNTQLENQRSIQLEEC
jgi:hypothetical protein